MSDVEKRRKFIINTVYFAILIALGLFAVKYALGVCFPIVFSLVVAMLLQRPKNFLVKKTFFKSGFASAICVFGLILGAITLIVLVGVRAVEEIRSFIDYIVLQLQNIDSLVNMVEDSVMAFIGNLPDFISENVSESITTIFTQIREFLAGTNNELANQVKDGLGGSFSISWITAPLSGVITTAKEIPSILIAIVITLVATCFMTSEYDKVKEFFVLQFPDEKRKDLSRAKALLKSSLSKMGKAYLLIMLITFIEMSVGLTILSLIGIFQSNYIIIIAVVTAIVDIVPMLGTGTVIIPWAVYSLIVGDYGMAIGLIIIYAVITVIRQIIEPKLVAGQLGLSPIVTIFALYLGLKIFGFLGMFIAPLLIIMLKLLNDEGIIKLWRSPTRVKAEAEAKKQAEEKQKSSSEQTE
ncbi:MAG: sporulation integral membrane protein YtvI [Clostridia bacterium]|nr:sporulation integral membrane protein YtvI [Clostridia bacterium]